MLPSWFKRRGYRHFDVAVGASFVEKIANPSFVAAHAWSPLISYTKTTKRYRPADGKTVPKERTIMYASHRDACILSKYAHSLTNVLDARYSVTGLDSAVIAYRKLGLANYDFASEALDFARGAMPCVVLCFDISGFFDNLDHAILKRALASLIGTPTIPPDWYAVLKAVTRYRTIKRSDLEGHPTFGSRIRGRPSRPIATIVEVLESGITVHPNTNTFGIPQGTPISAALSNAYMLEFDTTIQAKANAYGAMYQRYSDDILIICPVDVEVRMVTALIEGISSLKLDLNEKKTERFEFTENAHKVFQYLGFVMSPRGAVIRQASLARQWRKAKRNVRRTSEVGKAAIESGASTKTYTRKLRRRFMPVGVRNFSSYARRSASAFRSKQIVRQVLRLERRIEEALRDLT